jgi:hypothetical protein
LPLPPSLVPVFLAPLLCASFQFVVYSVFFFAGGGSVCAEGYAGLSWGLLGEYCMMLGFHLFGMPNVFLWCCGEPSCFLRVTLHGEAFLRLGTQGVEVLILLHVLFLPSMAPASQQDF